MTLPNDPINQSNSRPQSGAASAAAISQAGADAVHAAKDAAREIGRAARDYAADAKAASADLLRQASAAASARAEVGKSRLTDTLQRVAADFRNSADGLSDDGAWVKEALKRGANALNAASSYVDGRPIGALLHEAEDFARRNPTAYFGASVAVGFVLARLAKTATARARGQSPDGEAQTNSIADEWRAENESGDGGVL